MATITAVVTNIPTIDNSHIVSWAALTTTDDVGSALEMAGSPDRSVQVIGTFGVGGTCVIQGSNDGTNYATLTDPQGNALSFTATGLEAVTELTRYIRPRITAGDGTTSLTAYLFVKR